MFYIGQPTCCMLQGYGNYVTGVYVICSVVLALAVTTIVIAVVLRKDDTANVWLGRSVCLGAAGRVPGAAEG